MEQYKSLSEKRKFSSVFLNKEADTATLISTEAQFDPTVCKQCDHFQGRTSRLNSFTRHTLPKLLVLVVVIAIAVLVTIIVPATIASLKSSKGSKRTNATVEERESNVTTLHHEEVLANSSSIPLPSLVPGLELAVAETTKNTPGECILESPIATVLCEDGRHYPKRYACSGQIRVCEASCPPEECDKEVGFLCVASKKCISRAKVCDYVLHCSDGSDESPALCSCSTSSSSFRCVSEARPTCIPKSKVCDGYVDCIGGEDESKCLSCVNNPDGFYCEANMRCLTSARRCDGFVDCPDYSDEDNCTCTACKSHYGYRTFMCRNGQRCLSQANVCNPHNSYHCPGNPPEDEDKTWCNRHEGQTR